MRRTIVSHHTLRSISSDNEQCLLKKILPPIYCGVCQAHERSTRLMRVTINSEASKLSLVKSGQNKKYLP